SQENTEQQPAEEQATIGVEPGHGLAKRLLHRSIQPVTAAAGTAATAISSQRRLIARTANARRMITTNTTKEPQVLTMVASTPSSAVTRGNSRTSATIQT